MTPEQLEELILRADASALASALNPLDERARKVLAPKAYEFFKASNDFEMKSELARKLRERRQRPVEVIPIAMLACCDATKVRRVEPHHDAKLAAAMLSVLLARKPAWIDSWIARRLEAQFVPPQFWDVVRGLVRAGVAQRPTAAAYIALMADGMRVRAWERQGRPFVPLSQLLLEDAALLEWEVWRLFETEHRAFDKDWFATSDRVPPGYETWTQALLKLSAQGTIERAKLLDAALGALSSGLRPVTLGTFMRFAEAMEATDEELQERQAQLCQFLSNPTGIVVTFGIEGLARLEKAGLLDREAFLSSVAAALAFPTKAQATAALGLVRTIAKKDPALRARAVAAAIPALSNPADKVQSAFLDMVEEFPDAVDDPLRGEIAQRLDDVAATLRERAAGLTKGLVAASAAPSLDLAGVEERLARLPREEADRWGLPEAAAALREGRLPTPRRVPPTEQDFVPIRPIASPEELIECVAEAIELVRGADEVERIIDAIARFSDHRPVSRVAGTVFARFAAPTSSNGLSSSMGLPAKLVVTVARWFAQGNDFAARWDDKDPWWAARFGPYLAAIGRRQRWQPLASPTHRGGWVDPRVFVARLAAAESVDDSDFIQAMLRLAPFGRAEALQRCGELSGKWRDLAEFALGGELRLGLTDVLRAPLWIAAGRARQPHGDLVLLARLPGVSGLPDAIHESRCELASNEPAHPYVIRGTATPLKLDAAFDADGSRKAADYPQCGLYPRGDRRYGVDWLSPWVLEWRSQIWPANGRGFVFSGINQMLGRFDMASSAYEPNYAVVESLRPISKSLGALEALALGIACMSGEQEVRRSASEVLAQAAIEGRIDADSLGAALLELHGKGWSSMGRLGKTLAAVGADSPQAAKLVVTVVSRFIGTLEALPKGGHELLEILYQQSHRLGIPADAAVARKVGGIKGKSKTGQLAQQLVSLKADAGRSSSASAEALERLLAIASRGAEATQ